MSQHYFSTSHEGGPVTVLLGWDRPLGHFFMVIEKPPVEEGDSQYLYSNLNEKNAFNRDLAYYKSKLAEFGLSVPAAMFEQIEKDQSLNVGNRMVWYREDGTFQEN